MASSPFSHPSIRAQSPLVDSYTYHSIDAELALALSNAANDQKGKGRQSARDGDDATVAEEEEEVVAPVVQGKWMLGVDEAGRGPVLGAWGRVVLWLVLRLRLMLGLGLGTQDHRFMESLSARSNMRKN